MAGLINYEDQMEMVEEWYDNGEMGPRGIEIAEAVRTGTDIADSLNKIVTLLKQQSNPAKQRCYELCAKIDAFKTRYRITKSNASGGQAKVIDDACEWLVQVIKGEEQ